MLVIRPSFNSMIRSAISPCTTLCVIITVVVPSSRFTLCRASRTMMPVSESSAPVGSSQNNNDGCLAFVLAMYTHCCFSQDCYVMTYTVYTHHTTFYTDS